MVPKEELYQNKFKVVFDYKVATGNGTGNSSNSCSDNEDSAVAAIDEKDLKFERQNLLEKLALARKEIETLEDEKSQMTVLNIQLRRELSKASSEKSTSPEIIHENSVLEQRFVPVIFCILSLIIGLIMGKFGWQ